MSYSRQTIQIIPPSDNISNFKNNEDLSTPGIYMNSNIYSSIYPTEDDNYETVSANQSLAGTANPRTKIPPIIVARPQEFEYWKDTPISKISIINKKGVQYPKLAGYSDKNLRGCSSGLVDMDCVCPNTEDCGRRKDLGNFFKPNPLIQTIQPGIYTLPTEYDPINNNIGISETPQFEKNTQINIEGNDIFVPKNYESIGNLQDVGSNRIQPVITEENYEPIIPRRYQNDVSMYNVYDPRFNSYGSDNRNYLEPVTNQQRYYYDDVNSIRMPNYIVRSKIDSCITDFGETYGPMKDFRSNLSLNEVRPFAEQSYLKNNLDYRNDLMETLLRKRNSEMWQIRQAPKYTQGQSRWR